MPKNLFQDMVKINHTRKEQTGEKTSQIKQIPEVMNEKRRELREAREVREIETRPSVGRRRFTLWFVAGIAVVFFLFSLSYLFSRAEVTVDPKIQDVVLNENLSANQDDSTAPLSFGTVVISGEESRTVVATEEKEVSQNAEGTVVIYNAFSAAAQALDIDTRLEGSNGKIYKAKTKTVVPGKALDGTPGSVEVQIYGAEVGEAYNSTPLDFTIFGFKGTPKYTKFYARSKGDIIGGFKGKSHVVSAGDQVSALAELKNILKDKLLKKATDQIPSGFVLFKDATIFEIADNGNNTLLSLNDTMPLTEKGTLYGILFDEKQLAKKIAQDKVDKYDGSDVYISNIQNLTFALSAQAGLTGASLKDLKTIDFNLSGNAKIVWKFDVDKLATDLMGKSKKDFNQILAQYPNINSANLSLSPLWNSSIPNNSKDIKIIVNYPK